MRKIFSILATLVIASMLLVACAQEETATAVPGTDVVPTDEFMTQVPDDTEEPLDTQEPMATDTLEPGQEGTPSAGIPVTGDENPYLLSNQLDYDVWNGENDQIGEVENMVIDLASSQVSYVHIETGGFLDIGDTDSLVPWSALRLAINNDPDALTSDDNTFILQIDQNLLEDSPDVDLTNDLPRAGEPDNNWDADLNTYWENAGIDLSPAADGATMSDMQGVILATDLLDANITVNPNGEVEDVDEPGDVDTNDNDEGTAADDNDNNDDDTVAGADFVESAAIDNVFVDIHSGQVMFIVLDASLQDEERFIPVPLNHLQWDADNQAFVLNADQSMVEGAPYYQEGQYPDTTVDGWEDEYFNYWQ